MTYYSKNKKNNFLADLSYTKDQQKASAYFCLNQIAIYSSKLPTRSLLACDLRTYTLLLALHTFDIMTIEHIELLFTTINLPIGKRGIYYLTNDLCKQKLISKNTATNFNFFKLKKAGFKQLINMTPSLKKNNIIPCSLCLAFESSPFTNYYASVPGAHKMDITTAAISVLGVGFENLYFAYDSSESPWSEEYIRNLNDPHIIREEGSIASDIFFSDDMYEICAYNDGVRKRGLFIEIDRDTERLGKRGLLTKKLENYSNALIAQIEDVDPQRYAGIYNVIIAFSSETRGGKKYQVKTTIPSITNQVKSKILSLKRTQEILNTPITFDNIYDLSETIYGIRFSNKIRELIDYGKKQNILSEDVFKSLTNIIHFAVNQRRDKEYESDAAKATYINFSYRQRLCKLLMQQYEKNEETYLIKAMRYGLSVQATSLNSLCDFLKTNSLSYYVNTITTVLEKLKIINSNKLSILNFYDCKPIFYDLADQQYKVYLKNLMTLSDGEISVHVAVEDISNDLGAFLRVREYLESPCRIGTNFILIILTDNFTFFSGETYDEYNLFGRTITPSIITAYQLLLQIQNSTSPHLPIMWPYALSYILMDKNYYSNIATGTSYQGTYSGIYANSNGMLIPLDHSNCPPGFLNKYLSMHHNTLTLNPSIFS